MPRLASDTTGERVAMFAFCGVAVLGCLLGFASPPSAQLHERLPQQALDLVRVVSTAALAVTLSLGPGIVWRARRDRRRLELGFLPLPGLALLAAIGLLAWALAGQIAPRLVCSVGLLPVLAWLLISLRRLRPNLLEAEERRVLLVVGCVLGLAIARTLWSLGPSGELYAGTISRTLEVGDRSDSRVSFHVVQLVAHGTAPFSSLATSYFNPYNFSDRGPLAGIASAPVVLLAGGRPPRDLPNQPWAPFDPQGFMAYRIAMMAFASTAFLSLWTLTRRLRGQQAARLALLLAATTPFLVHEVWFTWPKMLAASFVLLAAASVIGGRLILAGLLVGIGYLVHPVALVSLPALLLLALWPLVGAHLRAPRLRPALLLLAGAAVCVVAWRLVNGPHYTQTGFLDYLTSVGSDAHVTPGSWSLSRLESVGNTLVPLQLVLFSANDAAINVFGGTSPGVVHFFFQYWTALPFGAGIVFFPLLLLSLWRAARLWKWPVLVGVLLPLIGFAVYWGSSTTGMLREGLQTWVLTLFVVVAIEQQHEGFPWLRSTPKRAILALRSAEVLAVAMVTTLVTRERVVEQRFALTDVVSVVAMVAFCGCLAALVWRERDPLHRTHVESDITAPGDVAERAQGKGLDAVGPPAIADHRSSVDQVS